MSCHNQIHFLSGTVGTFTPLQKEYVKPKESTKIPPLPAAKHLLNIFLRPFAANFTNKIRFAKSKRLQISVFLQFLYNLYKCVKQSLLTETRMCIVEGERMTSMTRQ